LLNEIAMNRLLKSLFVAGAVAGALSGCATYDYGYGYTQPYYGYDASPYTYDYGYGYPYYHGYSPGYYVGPPVVGFDFRYRDNDRHDNRHWHRDRGNDWRGDRSSSNWRDDRRASANRDGSSQGTGMAAGGAEGRVIRQAATEPAHAAPRNLAPRTRAGERGSPPHRDTASGRRLCSRGNAAPRFTPSSVNDCRQAIASRRAASHSLLLAALDRADATVHLQVDDHELVATHLDRVYWPEISGSQPAITKRDYLRYLVGVSEAMLPHLRDRPLTLFRWPEGLAGRRVLEKHWKITLPPFVERIDVFSESKGFPDQYLLCNNLATLLWLANMGTLEFHTWHSRIRGGADVSDARTDFASTADALQASLLELPDYVLFDIDPFIYKGDEPKGREPSFNLAAFGKAVEVASWLKTVLDSLGLDALVKTSGKTGLHVIVPIRRTLRFDAVREIARFINAHLMREHPEEITTDWSVQRRVGKVFLDANMNARGKSLTAPYSPRGLPGAPVSLPLQWRQLKGIDPGKLRLPTTLPLLRKRGDPWTGWTERKQDFAAALRSASLHGNGEALQPATHGDRRERRTRGRETSARSKSARRQNR